MTRFFSVKRVLPARLKPATIGLALSLSVLPASLVWAQSATPAAAASAPEAAGTVPAERDPQALEVLATVGKYLRTLKTFAINVESTKDEVLENGQKVQFATSLVYRVKAPNHLRVDITGERMLRHFYINGKTFTQYAPRPNFYATIDAPGTIKEVLERAAQKYNVELPLADMFLWGTDIDAAKDIKEASSLGVERMSGQDCEHFAYRQEGVDWQLWVRRGAQPLPCKLVITTLTDPSQPQYSSMLKWNTTSAIADNVFVFTPPKGAKKIVAKEATE